MADFDQLAETMEGARDGGDFGFDEGEEVQVESPRAEPAETGPSIGFTSVAGMYLPEMNVPDVPRAEKLKAMSKTEKKAFLREEAAQARALKAAEKAAKKEAKAAAKLAKKMRAGEKALLLEESAAEKRRKSIDESELPAFTNLLKSNEAIEGSTGFEKLSLADKEAIAAEAAAKVVESTTIAKLAGLKDKHPENAVLKTFDTGAVGELSDDAKKRLVQAVLPTIKNPASRVGCIAGQATDYDVIASLFDGVIAELHGDIGDGHPSSTWAVTAEAGNVEEAVPILLRARRNIAGFPFSGSMSRADRIELENAVTGAMEELEFEGTYSSITPGHASFVNRSDHAKLVSLGSMFENPVKDKYLAAAGVGNDWPAGRGCFVSEDNALTIWVGEEDHLTVMLTRSTVDVGAVFGEMEEVLTALDGCLPFAATGRFGYATASPANLGTALNVSVQIRLQHLVADGLQWLREMCGEFGLRADLVGKSGKNRFCELSNASTLGVTEGAVLDAVNAALATIFDAEQELAEAPAKARAALEAAAAEKNDIGRKANVHGADPPPSAPTPMAPVPAALPGTDYSKSNFVVRTGTAKKGHVEHKGGSIPLNNVARKRSVKMTNLARNARSEVNNENRGGVKAVVQADALFIKTWKDSQDTIQKEKREKGSHLAGEIGMNGGADAKTHAEEFDRFAEPGALLQYDAQEPFDDESLGEYYHPDIKLRAEAAGVLNRTPQDGNYIVWVDRSNSAPIRMISVFFGGDPTHHSVVQRPDRVFVMTVLPYGPDEVAFSSQKSFDGVLNALKKKNGFWPVKLGKGITVDEVQAAAKAHKVGGSLFAPAQEVVPVNARPVAGTTKSKPTAFMIERRAREHAAIVEAAPMTFTKAARKSQPAQGRALLDEEPQLAVTKLSKKSIKLAHGGDAHFNKQAKEAKEATAKTQVAAKKKAAEVKKEKKKPDYFHDVLGKKEASALLLANGGAEKVGKFLYRIPKADAPEGDLVLSVVYKGKATHHTITQPLGQGRMSLNGKLTEASSIEGMTKLLRRPQKEIKWPLGLTEHVVAEDKREVVPDVVKGEVGVMDKKAAAAVLLADGGAEVEGKFLIRRGKENAAVGALILSVIFKGKATHHDISQKGGIGPISVNKKETPAGTIASLVDYLGEKRPEIKWPLALTELVGELPDEGEERSNLFDKADKDGGGTIDLEEALKAGMTKEQFEEIDTDNSGTLTREEFDAAQEKYIAAAEETAAAKAAEKDAALAALAARPTGSNMFGSPQDEAIRRAKQTQFTNKVYSNIVPQPHAPAIGNDSYFVDSQVKADSYISDQKRVFSNVHRTDHAVAVTADSSHIQHGLEKAKMVSDLNKAEIKRSVHRGSIREDAGENPADEKTLGPAALGGPNAELNVDKPSMRARIAQLQGVQGGIADEIIEAVPADLTNNPRGEHGFEVDDDFGEMDETKRAELRALEDEFEAKGQGLAHPAIKPFRSAGAGAKEGYHGPAYLTGGSSGNGVNFKVPAKEEVVEEVDFSEDEEEENTMTPWYHGILSKKDAEKLLLADGGKAVTGKFLIRRQSAKSSPGEYYLSAIYKGKCTNHQLMQKNGEGPFSVNGKKTQAESLEAVINLLRNKVAAIKWPLPLTEGVEGI